MKKFIIKFFVFFIIVIAGAFFFDHAISNGLSTMNDYRYKCWNEIQEGNINADIIINGNSRALSHFTPSIIDSTFNCKSYNLGFGGHPFNAQYFKYGYYLHHNKKPKVIIQNVDFFTLADLFIIGHQREQVLPYVNESYMRKNLPHFGFSRFEIYLPLIRYFGYPAIIKNGFLEFFSLKHYNNKTSNQGYIPEVGSWNPSELNKLKTINFSKDSFTITLFEKYLRELKSENVKVFLVNSPIYFKASEKMIDRNQMNLYYNNIANKYGFKYLDYTNDPICYDSTKFVVAVHLNEVGANIFTRKLAEDLKKFNIFE